MRNLFLVSLFAVAASQASASQLNIGALSFGGNTGILNLSNVTGLQDGSYYAGPFDASLDGGATMRVFCGDLIDHTEFNAPKGVTPRDTAGLGAGFQKAAELFNKYAPLVGDDALKNSALQGAIWKSLFPTVVEKDGTAGASALADEYFGSTDLASYSDHATYYDFGGANQSMIGGYTPQAVPEPGALAALAVGAIGLLRRRKRAR